MAFVVKLISRIAEARKCPLEDKAIVPQDYWSLCLGGKLLEDTAVIAVAENAH
jgi:hypothetical protein